jgi:hypothetical protein
MNEEIRGLIQQLAEKVDKYTSSTSTTSLRTEFSFVIANDKVPRLEDYSNLSTNGITIHHSINGIVYLQDPTSVISLLDTVGKKKGINILYRMDSILSSNGFSVQQYVHSLRIGYHENIWNQSIDYRQTIDYLEDLLEKMSIKTSKEFEKIRDNGCSANQEIGSYNYWSWLIVPCFVTLTESLPIEFRDKLS